MDHLTNEIAAIKNHWPFYRFKNDHCSGLEKTQDRKRKHPLPQMEYQSLHPLFTANCHLFGRYHWVIYWNLSFYHRLKSDCRGCVFLEDARKIALFHLQVIWFYRFRHFQFWIWPLQHNFRCRNRCQNLLKITCDSLFRYCQRRNRPGRWFHITSSNTNFDQVSSSKSRSSINSKISSREASPQNLNFKIWTKPSFRISTEIQLHNLYKTSVAKYWTNSSLKILAKL